MKDAKSLPEYSGKDKGVIWRHKVSFYLMSKVPEIDKSVEWVDK